MNGPRLRREYQKLKSLAKKDLKSVEVARKLVDITREAYVFLEACRKVQLRSLVPRKTYFSFALGENFPARSTPSYS